jgi:hypothetical protein
LVLEDPPFPPDGGAPEVGFDTVRLQPQGLLTFVNGLLKLPFLVLNFYRRSLRQREPAIPRVDPVRDIPSIQISTLPAPREGLLRAASVQGEGRQRFVGLFQDSRSLHDPFEERLRVGILSRPRQRDSLGALDLFAWDSAYLLQEVQIQAHLVLERGHAGILLYQFLIGGDLKMCGGEACRIQDPLLGQPCPFSSGAFLPQHLRPAVNLPRIQEDPFIQAGRVGRISGQGHFLLGQGLRKLHEGPAHSTQVIVGFHRLGIPLEGLLAGVPERLHEFFHGLDRTLPAGGEGCVEPSLREEL